jgi:hypothetical protein
MSVGVMKDWDKVEGSICFTYNLDDTDRISVDIQNNPQCYSLDKNISTFRFQLGGERLTVVVELD